MSRLSSRARAGYRRLSIRLSAVTGTKQKRALLDLRTDLSDFFSLMKVDTPTSIVPASLLMLTRILESCPLLADSIGRLSGHMEGKKTANGLRSLATRILALSMGAYKAMGGGRMGLKRWMDGLEELERGRKRSKADTCNLGRKWCKLYRKSVYVPVYEGLVEVTGVFVEDLCELAVGTTVPRAPRMAVPNLAGVGGNLRPPYPLFPVGQVGGAVPPPPRDDQRSPTPVRGVGMARIPAPPPRAPPRTPSRSPSPQGPRPDGGGGAVAVALPPVAAAVGAPPSPPAPRRSARLQNVSRSVSPVLEPLATLDPVGVVAEHAVPLDIDLSPRCGAVHPHPVIGTDDGVVIEDDLFFDAPSEPISPRPRRSNRLLEKTQLPTEVTSSDGSSSYASAVSSQTSTPSPRPSGSRTSRTPVLDTTPTVHNSPPPPLISAHRRPFGALAQRYNRYYFIGDSSDEEKERRDREMLATRARMLRTPKGASGSGRKRVSSGDVEKSGKGDNTPKRSRRSPKSRKRQSAAVGEESVRGEESEKRDEEGEAVPEPEAKRPRRSLRRRTPLKWAEDSSSEDEEQRERERRWREDLMEEQRNMREQMRLEREEEERVAEMQRDAEEAVPMEEGGEGEMEAEERMEHGESMEVEEREENGEGDAPERY